MPRGEGDVRANYVYSPQLLLGLGNKKNVLSLSLSLLPRVVGFRYGRRLPRVLLFNYNSN